MRDFVNSDPISSLPYKRTDYKILQLSDGGQEFVEATAAYFVQSWMSSALPRMMAAWKDWTSCSKEDKLEFISYLEAALFTDGEMIDDPSSGYTSPIATFSETMLRWLRESFSPDQLLVEPAAPLPPGDGKIDFVEVAGFPGDYSSMHVTLWEVKGSDKQAHSHNSKIYRQLDDYPRRFYPIANCMAASYTGADVALKRFLRDVAMLVRNRRPQVHYGVLVAFDPNIEQKVSLVPHLHEHPPGHPSSSDSVCHTLAVLLVPDFKKVRLDVWRSLHLS